MSFEELRFEDQPRRLVPSSFRVVQIAPTVVRLITFSPFDPLTISVQAYAALTLFDGAETADVIDRANAAVPGSLDIATVKLLVDAGVLVRQAPAVKIPS
jgi:hypothetical protein